MKKQKRGRRLRWFKAVKKLDGARGRKFPEAFASRGVKARKYVYGHKRLRIDVSKLREPKPLLDVLNLGDGVLIVAELKGFKKENIKVDVNEQRLVLLARSQNRKFYRCLSLPVRVAPESMEMTYKNGVLEIRLKKAVEKNVVSRLVG
jgi:HSP20 family molecular chaperone IbpA